MTTFDEPSNVDEQTYQNANGAHPDEDDYGPKPPQDLNAERAVLGAMLITNNSSIVEDVIEILPPEDFYRPAHKYVYDTILDMYGKGKPFDAVTVVAELDKQKLLGRVGGAAYVYTIIRTVPTATNAVYYANIVTEKALLRRLIAAGEHIVQYGYAGAAGAEVSEVVGRAAAEIGDVVSRQHVTAQSTWEPVNLGPYLDGEVEQPQPTIGIMRSDRVQMFYPGLEHSVVGKTESGKSWFMAGCAAVELEKGNHVLYVHHEEPEPTSTIERLLLLGVDESLLRSNTPACRFRFIGPSEPPNMALVQSLLNPTPTLVIHDGVNEAMYMLGGETNEAKGVSVFRQNLVTPFMRAGAAVISCDHLPHSADGTRTAAIGSVHKGNALSGARIQIENIDPFGRGMRGVSNVYVTKDRPGFLRTLGKETNIPSKTFIGTLVIDKDLPEYMMFWAPRPGEKPVDPDPSSKLADDVYQVITAQPDQFVSSSRKLFALMRAAGIEFTDSKVRDALDDLIVQGRVTEGSGKNGGTSYKALSTASGKK